MTAATRKKKLVNGVRSVKVWVMVDGPSNDGFLTSTVMFLTFLYSDCLRMDKYTMYWVMIPFLPLLGGMDHWRRALLDLSSTVVGLPGATEGTVGGDMKHYE